MPACEKYIHPVYTFQSMFDYTTYQVGDIPLFMYAMVGMTTLMITYATVNQSRNDPMEDTTAPATEQPSTAVVGGKRKSKRKHGRGKHRTRRSA